MPLDSLPLASLDDGAVCFGVCARTAALRTAIKAPFFNAGKNRISAHKLTQLTLKSPLNYDFRRLHPPEPTRHIGFLSKPRSITGEAEAVGRCGRLDTHRSGAGIE